MCRSRGVLQDLGIQDEQTHYASSVVIRDAQLGLGASVAKRQIDDAVTVALALLRLPADPEVLALLEAHRPPATPEHLRRALREHVVVEVLPNGVESTRR